MRSRSLPLLVCILAVLLVGSGPRPLSAQDRGAPLFETPTPQDTVEAEASDAGRLWSVASPPFDRFEERYGVEADSGWVTHLRRGLLRLPGCTASLVSGQGLALTTARCVRRHLEPEGGDAAFVAPQPSDERAVPGLTADRLVAASDVTAEVRAAKPNQDGSADRAMQEVENRLQAEASAARRVDVKEAGGGARYTAYVYRRYDDVRVAFLPERGISAFGGVDGSMTYPRSSLDVALVRVYTPEGRPLAPRHFFDPSSQGLRPGDPVFSVGHSTETRRAESADQLAFRRDVVLPRRRARLQTWTGAVRSHLNSAEGAASRWHEALADAQQALKRTQARLQALRNETLMTRLRRRDEELRQALQQDPALGQRFGGLLDSLKAVQAAKRELQLAYRAFGGLASGTYGSSTLRRALLVYQAREADGSRQDSLWQRASEVPEQPTSVDVTLLSTQLTALRQHLDPDSAAVRALLQGAPPEDRAAAVVNASVLSQPDRLRALQNQEAGSSDGDPALALVDAFASGYRSFRDEWRALTHAERALTRRLARARVTVSPTPVLPATDGAPRLTDGRLLGYPYNGTTAPPFTTFYGLYSRSHSFGDGGAWALPDVWTPSPPSLDRSVPLTLAVSTDGAAGTDGAPLLNPYLELVGVTIGTNLQGVAGTYLFLPERMRTVAVDLRGLRQALTGVYGADPLANELFDGATGPSEASR